MYTTYYICGGKPFAAFSLRGIFAVVVSNVNCETAVTYSCSVRMILLLHHRLVSQHVRSLLRCCALTEQDSRWGDAEKKLLRRTKFSKVLEQKVSFAHSSRRARLGFVGELG